MIKLSKEAPWDKVKIGNVTITKTKWIEANFDYRPIKKYIIEQEYVEEMQPIIKTEEPIINFENLNKTQLIKLCQEKSIDFKGLTKAQLIEKLTKSL